MKRRSYRKPLSEIVLPFPSETFKQGWNIWKEYRRIEHNFRYKTNYSEQARLNSLYRMSKGNELWALEIIEQSMGNGWEGLFQLPLKSNGERDYKKRSKPTSGTAGRVYQNLNQQGEQLLIKFRELQSTRSQGVEGNADGGETQGNEQGVETDFY